MVQMLFLFASFVLILSSRAATATPSASEIVPANTIFFLSIKDVPSFYESFVKDHQLTLSLPVVDQTIKNGAQNSVMKLSAAEFQTPLATDASALAYTVVQKELFLACVPAASPGQTAFLAGGISQNATASLAKIKAEFSAKIPLPWGEMKLDSITAQTLQIPEIGTFYLCSQGDWVLYGTSLPALKSSLSLIKQPGEGLASTELWKSTMEETPNDCILHYFARVEAFAELAEKQGTLDVANLFRKFNGCRAYAWAFTTQGPGGVAVDRFHYNLTPETTSQLRSMLPPLGPGWRALAGAKSVALIACKADLQKLAAAPVLQGMNVSEFLKGVSDFLGASAAPAHSIFLIDQSPDNLQTYWGLAVRGEQRDLSNPPFGGKSWDLQQEQGDFSIHSLSLGFRKDFWWLSDSTTSLAYFSTRPMGEKSELLVQTDTLPGVENAFLDLRMDLRKITSHALKLLSKNYEDWLPILRKRGVALADEAPQADLDPYLGRLRSTVGISGQNLVLLNSFQLGPKTGSTLITASSSVAEVAFHDELTKIRGSLQQAFADQSDSSAKANFFDTFIWSYFLFGPLMPPDQTTFISDIFAQLVLASQSDLQ